MGTALGVGHYRFISFLHRRRRRRRIFCTNSKISCEGAHPLLSPLSRRGFDQNKLNTTHVGLYGRLKLTASAVNRTSQYASSLVAGPTTTWTHRIFLAVAETVATRCTYHGGWVGLENTGMVTNPSTNRARRSLTSMMWQTPLPLREASHRCFTALLFFENLLVLCIVRFRTQRIQYMCCVAY